MTTLAAAITADQTVIQVTPVLATGPLREPIYFIVDDEAISVTGGTAAGAAYVNRGLAGTTKATHASAATLTRYHPDAPDEPLTLVGLAGLAFPSADPEVAGALFTDGAPSAGTPKALKVSGGPA